MTRAALVAVGLSLSAALGACGGASGPAPRAPSVVVVADAPDVAALASTGDGGFLFGERRTGRVRAVDAAGVVEAAPLATLPVRTDGQRGLLGLAVDPARRVFAAWTRPDGRLVVAEVAPGAERTVWIGPSSADLANGGHLDVDAEGRLLIGVGDLQQSSRIDDPAAPNGKLLALDPDGPPVFVSTLQGRGLSASSCRQTYHLLGMILRAAVEDGRLVTTPCVGIKLPRLPQVEMAFLSPPELRQLLEVIPPEHRLLIEVLAIGGLRFGEAAALRRFRVELERSRLMVAESLAEVSGVLHFGAPKTHQRRAVTLPRFLRDRLSEHLETSSVASTQQGDLVLQAARGGPIRYNNFFGRVWKPLLAKAQLPDMGIHALRHTCAALLISQGAHPKAIQSHLGHRSITTTLDRYGHLSADEHERLAERIDAAYESVVLPKVGSGRLMP